MSGSIHSSRLDGLYLRAVDGAVAPWCFVLSCALWLCSTTIAEEEHLTFRNVAVESGLEFTHISAFTDERHLHLTMGSGLGWLDFDVDGCPDLYLGQGCPWSGSRGPQRDAPSDVLFRGFGDHFARVDAAGIESRAYAMGVAIGDYDNDGFADVFVANFGPNVLFQNNGDGTFSTSAATSVLAYNGYGASCTWFDAESDGDLDLFVTNYVEIEDADYLICREDGPHGEVPIACQPWKYQGSQDRYYVNNGDGDFTEQTSTAGFQRDHPLHGLGVVASDFDGDRLTDLFVANDSAANELWVNMGNGQFEDWGVASGTAFNREGKREAGMGVAGADVDQDGAIDLFVTHYFQETNTLYRNLGQRFFLDVTNEFGMAAPSRTRLGFGTVMCDFNNDGYPDCMIANGHIHDRLKELERNIPFAQLPQLLLNRNGRRFDDVSASCGGYFEEGHVGRGVAVEDFDGDGHVDIAVQHCNGSLALLRNELSNGSSISVRLIGTTSARDPIGTRLQVHSNLGVRFFHVEGSSSYLSTNGRTLHIPIRSGEIIDSICTSWLDGSDDCWKNIPSGGDVVLVQGSEIVRDRR